MPSASGVFTVSDFAPTDYASPVTTGVGVGHAHMVKTFTGDVAGRSTTQFTYAFDDVTGTGTYLAMETFEGSVDGRTGTLNIAHSATTTGDDRTAELFVIVPNSGTGELAGLTGSGALIVDPDGTHHLRLDYRTAGAAGE